MNRLRQTGRLIYLLALFQLAGGPLVICAVILVGKLASSQALNAMRQREGPVTMISSEPVDQVVAHLADMGWEQTSNRGQPAAPQKAKDGKGKIWAVRDAGAPVCLTARTPFMASLPWESEWLPRRSHPPPIPPPRWM